MAATSASLATLLETKAQIAYWTQQQMIWTRKYDSNLEKLEKYEKYENDWNKAFDKVMDSEDGKAVEWNGNKYYNNEADAERYANIKVDERDEEIFLELSDLDVEYESMKQVCETMLETLRANADGQKQLTSTNAQDTGLLGGG